MSLDQLALAKEAIIYTLPLYEMARMQSASSPRRNAAGVFADPAGGPESTLRWANLFSHTRHLLGPADRRVVTPNNDTLYTNAWLDLTQGPLLLHAPDTGARYYVLGFLDFYTNPFAYSGTRTTGTGAQTLLVHGPGWSGEVAEGAIPAGAIRIAAPTNHVWVLGRILATAAEPLEPVHRLQDAFRIVSAGRPQEPSAAAIVDAGIGPRDLPGDPAIFARVVNRALAFNPPPAEDRETVAAFAAAGIGPGLPVPADTANLGAALTQVLAELDAPQPSALGGGWTLTMGVRTSYGRDWRLRALIARGYIGALGMEEAMYVSAEVDQAGQPLDGRHVYRLRFAADARPEVDGFWSLTMYRKADYLLVDNSIQRYSIGDRTPALRNDADGGLTIILSHRPPPGDVNWLPAPAENFYVTLRLYLPHSSHLERRFVYPAVTMIET